jgi:hypothetical protein
MFKWKLERKASKDEGGEEEKRREMSRVSLAGSLTCKQCKLGTTWAAFVEQHTIGQGSPRCRKNKTWHFVHKRQRKGRMGDYSVFCHVKSSPHSRPSLFNRKYHDDLHPLNGEWNNNSSIEFGMVSKGEQLALKYICARTLLQLALLFTFHFISSFHASLNQTY